jgi:hypothetical protein
MANVVFFVLSRGARSTNCKSWVYNVVFDALRAKWSIAAWNTVSKWARRARSVYFIKRKFTRCKNQVKSSETRIADWSVWARLTVLNSHLARNAGSIYCELRKELQEAKSRTEGEMHEVHLGPFSQVWQLVMTEHCTQLWLSNLEDNLLVEKSRKWFDTQNVHLGPSVHVWQLISQTPQDLFTS